MESKSGVCFSIGLNLSFITRTNLACVLLRAWPKQTILASVEDFFYTGKYRMYRVITFCIVSSRGAFNLVFLLESCRVRWARNQILIDQPHAFWRVWHLMF